MEKAILVASLKTPRSSVSEALATLPDSVPWVEVRADLVGDLFPDEVRQSFRGGLLYTLRSRAEGGNSEATGRERRQRRLKPAAANPHIDPEGERDQTPAIPRWRKSSVPSLENCSGIPKP